MLVIAGGRSSRWSRLLSGGVLLLVVAGIALPVAAQQPSNPEVGPGGRSVSQRGGGLVESVRFAGLDRFDTAARVAEEYGAELVVPPADTAILARADVFPDALAGSYLSGLLDAPIVLTGTGTLDETTAAELTALAVSTVYVLGNEAAVAEQVVTTLAAQGYEVVRLGGVERNATAVQIATRSPGAVVGTLNGERVAIVARNEQFPDALVAGNLASARSFPLLLTAPDQLSEITEQALRDLEIDRVLVAGGSQAVGAGVEDELVAAGFAVTRVFGETRTGTAAAFARFAVAELGFRTDQVALARGDDFPDALALSAFAGREEISTLLTASPSALSTETEEHFEELASCSFVRLYVAGGVAAVTDEVEQQARRALSPDGDCGAELAGLFTPGESPIGAAVGALNGGAPDTVTLTYEVPAFCNDQAPAQFTYTDDDSDRVAGASVVCNGTTTVVLTFPDGTLAADDPGVVDYVQSTNPANRVMDADGNPALSPDSEPVVVPGAASPSPSPSPMSSPSPTPAPSPSPAPSPTSEPADIDLTPESATNFVGEEHTVTATVTDDTGDPVAGVQVAFTTTTESGTAQAVPGSGNETTSADGTATFSFTSAESGTVTVTGSFDAGGRSDSDTVRKTFVPFVSRFVAFASTATNLVPGDTNGNRQDVFVRDRLNGTTELVSVDSDEAQGNGNSFEPSVSADGRFVAFSSFAPNLVRGDTNNTSDVFVRDRLNGTTERVSVDSDEAQASGASADGSQFGDPSSGDPSISADGRFIVFRSGATNLVPGDTNGAIDVFVRDRRNGTTERVSVDSGEAQANDGVSSQPSVSADGRFVAFASSATNLAPDESDTNDSTDVFVRDRQAGTTERVSVDSGEAQADGASFDPSISADGRFVAFSSDATNLAPDDSTDVFVRDRRDGTTELVSVDSGEAGDPDAFSFQPSISADGRFVAFASESSLFVPGDTNDSTDVFVRDRRDGTTERVNVGSDEDQANSSSFEPSISADGGSVAFRSGATNLVPGDTNNTDDVFVRDRRHGTTERVSVDSNGVQGNNFSFDPSVSAGAN